MEQKSSTFYIWDPFPDKVIPNFFCTSKQLQNSSLEPTVTLLIQVTRSW